MAGWNLSCPDWRERLKDGRTLVPTLPLWPGGDRAVKVFDRLRLADVPGTPTMAEAGGDWFRDIVRALFGAVDPVTKARAIRELFLLVPKKNSKTTNGALLMLTALLLNERPRAPLLLTAPVQKTADEAFSAVAGAIALDPVLEAKLHVRDHLKTIVHRETKARLEIATFDPAMMTGKKVVAALVDELHVLGKMPRAEKAMLQLRGGMQPFPEAFLATITTQSDDVPAGAFKDDLEKARAVRDGLRQTPILPVLYEFPEEIQRDEAKPWLDTALWPMVTPNAGRSIDIATLATAFEDEKAKGEGALRLWASQHLNIEIGLALHANRWPGVDFWKQQARPGLTLDAIIARSDVITLGIDGGGLDDLLALVVIGRDHETGEWMVWARCWAHLSVLERRKSEASRLRDFEAQGDLMIVERMGADVDDLVDHAEKVFDSGLMDKIGVDPAGIKTIVVALQDRGIPEDKIVGVRQGWSLGGAIKTAERLLAEETMVHAGQPLMDWQVSNAKVEPRANSMLVTKQASGTGKIDAVMALFCAVTLMALNPGAVVLDDGFELLTV